jgi:uncharacterized membrane protein
MESWNEGTLLHELWADFGGDHYCRCTRQFERVGAYFRRRSECQSLAALEPTVGEAVIPLLFFKKGSFSWSAETGRVLLAAFFVSAGSMHFVIPYAYVRIVPPALPTPGLLVVLSGIAEILGGVGLLLPLTRRTAAWGLTFLLFAVFPANIYTAVSHISFPGILGQSWLQWLRLPLQIPLILWTMSYTRRSAAGLVGRDDSSWRARNKGRF